MPELPEVETVRRGLQPFMEGHAITRVEVRRPNLRWPFPERLAERLTGHRVLALRRRSKYILIDLDHGETLLLHLGMSGRVLIQHRGGTQATGAFHHMWPMLEKHDHLVLELGENRIVLNDPRRFGAVDLLPTDQADKSPLLAGLGPEPLGNRFDATYLSARLAGRKTPIKAALLDQRTVAGLGNIYVCEALWRAGISPLRQAGAISGGRIETLVQAIRAVLRDAIEAGGSTLKDYRKADGDLGYFQHSFAVYDREGQPCRTPGCAGTIVRIVQSGRSTYYCRKCQR